MTAPTPRPPQMQPPGVASAVRTVLAGLDGIDDRPLAEHIEVFERVHVVLGEALADQGVA